MTAPQPDREQAARLVATAQQLGATVHHAAAWRYVAWLTGMAATNALFFTGLGIAGRDDVDVLLITATFVVTIGVLCASLLPGSRAMSAGMKGRWSRAMLTWGLLFGLAMGAGLPLLRDVVPFWLAMSIVVPLPLALGARAEALATQEAQRA